MKKEMPIRIAHIIGKWLGGGVEAVVMNYYRNIDRTKIQFDFICDNDSTNIPYDEIERLGGKVILIPSYQKVFKYHKELKKVLKEGNYKIVHSHINTLSVFSLFAAKCAKVPIRIAHSHSTTNKKEWKKNMLKIILRPFIKLVANNYMACTEYAGLWMFGRKIDFFVLNNAIDLNIFKPNIQKRIEKRKELKISNESFVIGHVGRFVKSKNHDFLIDVFYQFHKKNENSILLLIGQGPLVNDIKKKVINLNIEKNVIFLGQRSDVNELYQAMDIFLFPSIYEGLGMAAVEAQFSGIKTIVSNFVPNDTNVSNYIYFCNLNSTEEWINAMNLEVKNKEIYSYKRDIFDIKKNALKLEKYYLGKENQYVKRISKKN